MSNSSNDRFSSDIPQSLNQIEADSAALKKILTEPIAIAPEFKNKYLLVINSSPTIQKIIANYAQSWGMFSQPAYGEVEALKHLEVSDFDAVIIDQNLQSFDILELAINIHDIFPSLPIIFLSSESTHNLPIPNLCPEYLTKPITKSKLYQVLLNVFSSDNIQIITPQPPSTINSNINIDFAETYPLNILIVEDNLVNQQILVLMLERLGYQGNVVNHGLEAVQALQKRNYDLIFMDIQMPIMDGLTACQQIRQLSERNPWILGLSANASQDAREAALAVGMNDYLTKPLKIEDLIITLRRVAQSSITNNHVNIQSNIQSNIQNSNDHEFNNKISSQGLNRSIDSAVKQLHFSSRNAITSSSVYFQADFSISGLEVINKSTIEMLEQCLGKADLAEIIKAYLSESERSILAIQCALKDLDFAKISFENHSLKGGCGTLGADRMVAICKELYTLCKSKEYVNKAEIAEILIQQLELEYIKIRQFLQDILQDRI